MKLPKKISPCPIEEAIFEIRFEPSSPDEAVFGIVYSYLKEKYSKVESLSILDLPEKIRKQDQNLKYKPYHRLKYNNYILQVGPRVISLAVKNNYPGWDTFYSEIKWVLNQVLNSDVVKKVERNSLRYINLFETDIFQNIDLKITLKEEKLNSDRTYFKTQIVEDGILKILQIANNASFGEKKNVSIIDVDIISNEPKQDFIENNKKLLERLHLKEKRTFFPLLSESFLNSLNPIY